MKGNWEIENEWVNGQIIKIDGKFNYLGVRLERMGGWDQQKTLAKAKGSQAFVATEKCVSGTLQ